MVLKILDFKHYFLPINREGDKMRSSKKKNEKIKFSKKVVAGIIILNVLFTIAVLVIFASTGVEPVALITAWFAFTTGELWALSGIKKKETAMEQLTMQQFVSQATPNNNMDKTPTGEGLIDV